LNVMEREPDLATARVWLRRWRDDDRPAFAAMNADPEVMRHFPALLTHAESDALIRRFDEHFAEHGYGIWALEIPGVCPLAGFVGLKHVDFDAHFTPALEIGWRLRRDLWGRGYASEAAEAVLAHAFDDLLYDEIVSFTTRDNERSRAVMERIGLFHDVQGDFEHPKLPPGHRQRPHVLYRARRPV
jgi:RimJ/RimL family protein N-acetyltransferase